MTIHVYLDPESIGLAKYEPTFSALATEARLKAKEERVDTVQLSALLHSPHADSVILHRGREECELFVGKELVNGRLILSNSNLLNLFYAGIFEDDFIGGSEWD